MYLSRYFFLYSLIFVFLPLISYYPCYLSFWLCLHSCYFLLFFLSFMYIFYFHSFVPFILLVGWLTTVPPPHRLFLGRLPSVSHPYSHCPFVTVAICLRYRTTNNSAYVNLRVSVLYPLYFTIRAVTVRRPHLARIACQKRFPNSLTRKRGVLCAVSRHSIIKSSWL